MSVFNMPNIEYILETQFVTGLRAVFTYDDLFPYNNNRADTKVLISSTFPEKEYELKIPQIVVSGINYQFSQTSLFNNFMGDIIDEETKVVIGKRYGTQVPYNVSLMCIASVDGIAKDLTNRVFDLISFGASEIFNDELHLNIMDIAKSSGGQSRMVPSVAFTHSLNIRGVLNWVGNKITSEGARQILDKIRLEVVVQSEKIRNERGVVNV